MWCLSLGVVSLTEEVSTPLYDSAKKSVFAEVAKETQGVSNLK